MFIPISALVAMCLIQLFCFGSIFGIVKEHYRTYYRRKYRVTDTDKLFEQTAEKEAKRNAWLLCGFLSSIPYIVIVLIGKLLYALISK